MSHLHMTQAVTEVRTYDQADGYARRLPYKAIVRITHLSDKLAYLHAAVGTLEPGDFPALLAMLKAQGITAVQFERHGRMQTRALD